ncbi:Gamma-butyrobetaine dioxygenase [Mizuhopecten yessoensis]|uniref:Gamma-butyrobetaine dioxygenase n=1 Tax=Mizuhopecten yessoensis TaxID=6573 RepID=A0A210Q716_MIZYE|nr:Gamma-butyrobetaine dioxygenase [Mizuhopecten yessoensis]
MVLKRNVRLFIPIFQRNFNQTAGGIETINIADDRKTLSLKWKDGVLSSFHSKWLRFNCRCSKCNDTANSWIWPAHEIPMTLTIQAVSTTEDGHVHVQWNEEDHDGILPGEHLLQHCYSKENQRRLRDQAKLHFNSEVTIPEMSWRDVQSSEYSLYRWLRNINDPGLCLLTDVPAEHHYARNVLSKIGCLTGTLYGEIWDVKLHKKMINSAYGRQALLFHTDLAIYEAQPGVQFLHCLRFDDSLEGGETLFVDLYHIAETFRRDFPEEFRLLTQVPFTFTRIHYDRADPVHMILRRPLIALNDENRIINMTWHEHELGPPLVNENNVEEFYQAYQLFSRAINDFPYRRVVRLRKGDMICFNNRRLAHARNAFTGEGERHLQGCYVNSDDFKSKLMYLSHKLDDGRPVCHVGNTDWT